MLTAFACCTALALVLGDGAAHGQGYLPQWYPALTTNNSV